MSIFNPYLRMQQTRSMTIPSTNMSSFIIENGIALPNHLVSAEYALKNADVFAVINLLSSDVASSTITAPAPFASVLRQPSQLISGYNFWQSVTASMLLSGNAYVVIKRDASNIPTSLELVPTGSVNVILDDNSSSLAYQINYADNRGSVSYPSSSMLHFRLLSTGSNQTDSLIGISPLQSLVQSVNMQDFSGQLTLSTLKNAINPSVRIKVNEGALSSEEKEATRKAFEVANSGVNAGRPLVEDQLYSVDTLQINSDVAKFLSTLDFGKTAIAEAFGVPAAYLNGQGDQQSSLDMTKSLYQNALRRYTQPIEAELGQKLGVNVDFDESVAVDSDNNILINQIQKLLSGTTPAITADQAQAMLLKRGVIDG
ncbi:phage portal protein [Lacticaseibacillus sp. 866-1]|uniref:phage portal protein n=1 Tax=Lacticaseibacillus sp. 866-1 TaxID=2799576 RepID=UPI001945829E|nr:phage portal protein [Lacticaseibacillus sp. 866-1]